MESYPGPSLDAV